MEQLENAYTDTQQYLKILFVRLVDDNENLLLEPYNDDVELKFVELRNVNETIGAR